MTELWTCAKCNNKMSYCYIRGKFDLCGNCVEKIDAIIEIWINKPQNTITQESQS